MTRKCNWRGLDRILLNSEVWLLTKRNLLVFVEDVATDF